MSAPILTGHAGLSLLTLPHVSTDVCVLEVDILNVLTPALRAGQDFYTNWSSSACGGQFQFVRRGERLTAFVMLSGEDLAVEVEEALTAEFGPDEHDWHVQLRSHQPVVQVAAAVRGQTATLLAQSVGEGYVFPLRAGLGPEEQRVIVELHLLRAREDAQRILTGARAALRGACRTLAQQAQQTVLN